MYLFSIYPESFRELTLADGQSYEDYDCLLWVGQSKADTWQAPTLDWLEDEFSSEDDKVPDITGFAGQMLLSGRAHEVLSDLFEDQVEFLPTIGPEPGDKWYLVNVTNVLEVMDTAKSQYEVYSNGKIGKCTHAYLNEPEPDNKIFKVKGYITRIFINEEVKSAIESASLSGPLIREYLNPK